MFYWALMFFIFAVVAGILGFGGIAHESAYIAKILAIVGIVLAVITFVFHRQSRRD
jgi:uncharacterized membrane protein YtjA (UPF0391 family)